MGKILCLIKEKGGFNMAYKYKKCSRCGKYNGTTMKMCSSCRKKASRKRK